MRALKDESPRGQLTSSREPSGLRSYHPVMRRGLFLVLMVVLVLRGLTGVAMAAGLMPPVAPAAAHHAQEQVQTHGAALTALNVGTAQASGHHHGGHASPVDHPWGTTASCESATDACSDQEHHASTCSACEICHSAMLTPFVPPAQAALAPGHARPLASAPFDSAPAASTTKPPIA